MKKIIFTSIFLVLFVCISNTAVAIPTTSEWVDIGNQDPLWTPLWVHELGVNPAGLSPAALTSAGVGAGSGGDLNLFRKYYRHSGSRYDSVGWPWCGPCRLVAQTQSIIGFRLKNKNL